MLKNTKLSQNNRKFGLFVEQAHNEYFWGHSSFVLQLPAHVTALSCPLLQQNSFLQVQMWRNRTFEKKKHPPLTKPVVWHWTAELYLKNNSLQRVHCSFSFRSLLLLFLTQGRPPLKIRLVFSHIHIHTHTFLQITKRKYILFFFFFDFSYWPDLVAFHITYKPIWKIFRLNFKFKIAQERLHCITLQLFHCKFK